MKDKIRKWPGWWIHGGSDPAPYLRKKFELKMLPGKALLHLCSPGWCEVTVNGRHPDDRVLSPVPTQFDKHVSYLTYDVTALLQPGRNTVVVLLGNGWYNCRTPNVWNFDHAPWLDRPKMICDLECDGKTVLVSDNSWKAVPSPILFNQLRNGETYDATKEIPGVLEADYDDSSCPDAGYINPPAGIVVKEDNTPCRICEVIEGTFHRLTDRLAVWDFGKNLTGWCEIQVTGPRGSSVKLEYAERILTNGDITRENISKHVTGGAFQTDTYILKGNGVETWHPRFTYHGFQYCRVIADHDEVTIHNIRAHFVHSDFAEVGHFECSHPLVNKIWQCTRQSYLSNYTGIPTDCPHREKNGWTGDAQLAMEFGLWTFDCVKAATAFNRVLMDGQRAAGQFSGIAPTGGWGYDWGGGPAWDLYLFEAPWRIFLFTGDDAPFREALPAMERYLAYCEQMSHEGGLVDFGLGDWCCLNRSRRTVPEFTSSACYFYALSLLARWKSEYADRAEQVKNAINRKYAGPDGIYCKGERTALACALYFGFAEDPVKTAVLLVRKVREHGYRTGFGILGSKYIFRALADHGYAEDAFRLLTSEEYPSYGYWIKSLHATTLHEHWSSSSSLNHIMFGDVGAWMYQYPAGITPLAETPGFRHFLIRPCFVSGLDSVNAEHLAPAGMIRVEWKRENSRIRFSCTIPDGCTADLELGTEKFPGITGDFSCRISGQ